ncbi:MAG TPA: PaaI family thioesterase [Xanthobacteraceae bacterium]
MTSDELRPDAASGNAGSARASAIPTAPFADHIGVKVTHVSPERVEGELLVRPEHANRNGGLHGGAVVTLADSLSGIATVANVPAGVATATIELKTNFLAPVAVGDVARAECTPLHRGRTTMVWQTHIRRGDGKLVAIVTQTQIVTNKGAG